MCMHTQTPTHINKQMNYAAHSDPSCWFVRSVEGGVGRASVGKHDFQEGAELRSSVHA